MRVSWRSLALGLAAWTIIGAGAAYAAGNQVAYFQTENIYHSGLRGTRTVALTFDDGPNTNTRAVLEVLKKYHVPGTFFIVGNMARAHPDVLAAIAQDGHLLANHSATHPQLGRRYVRNPELLLGQIRVTDNLIAPFLKPGDTRFFRAPYGYWRSAHAQALNADPVLKQYVGPVYWDEGGSIRRDRNGRMTSAADWQCWSKKWQAATCAKGYLREIETNSGGIVLMHCLRAQSAEMLDIVVPELQKAGYRFVRLDQIREFDRYKTPADGPAIALASAKAPRHR